MTEKRTWGAALHEVCGTVHSDTDVCPIDDSAVGEDLKVNGAKVSIAPNFESSLSILLDEVLHLVVRKQRDYGHANILTHGLVGLDVRIADKQARLHNLLCVRKVDPANESLRDTFMDIVGYGLLGLMVLDQTFELPLAQNA